MRRRRARALLPVNMLQAAPVLTRWARLKKPGMMNVLFAFDDAAEDEPLGELVEDKDDGGQHKMRRVAVLKVGGAAVISDGN